MPGIGKLLSERLHAAGMSSLRQLAAAEPRRIEATTQRHYPFGGAHARSSCVPNAGSMLSLLAVAAAW